MIESFNEFLKRTDSTSTPVFENNVTEGMLIPEESLRTGGSADRDMWEKEMNFVFRKPDFVFEDTLMKKVSSIVLKALRKHISKEWRLYPYTIKTDEKKSVMVYSNDTYLILTKDGIDKRIIVYGENPLNNDVEARMSVSTHKRGFLAMVSTLIGFLLGEVEAMFEAKTEPNITINPTMKTTLGISKAVDKIMGPRKGSGRDDDSAMDPEKMNEFLKLFESYDDGEIAKMMTSERLKSDDPLYETQISFFLDEKGDLMNPLNAQSRVVTFFHMALTGVTFGMTDKQIKEMQELWFWEGGKSGKLCTEIDAGGRWTVRDSDSVLEEEIDDLEENMMLEKNIVKRMIQYVQQGGKNGTAENLRGLVAKHRGLLVTGCAGIGKSVGIENAIEETSAKEGLDYIQIKAVSTSQVLFKQLYRFNGQVIIFDDVDSLFDDVEKTTLFKNVMHESEKQRTIQTTSAKAGEAMTTGIGGRSSDSEYYNALNTTRRERYYLEVGTISNYEKRKWIEKKINDIKRKDDLMKKDDKAYAASGGMSDASIRLKAEQEFKAWEENEQNSHYPTQFTFNGFIINITNKTLDEFSNDRRLKSHWGAISSRMSVIDISPRARVIWAWLKQKIYKSAEDKTINDEDRLFPLVGKAENATLDNVVNYIDLVMTGGENRNGKVYGKISFRTIANIRDYINSSDNSEKFWKRMILKEMLVSSEREQS
jgi:hypothetical protein